MSFIDLKFTFNFLGLQIPVADKKLMSTSQSTDSFFRKSENYASHRQPPNVRELHQEDSDTNTGKIRFLKI
jgi:hypothetical protein